MSLSEKAPRPAFARPKLHIRAEEVTGTCILHCEGRICYSKEVRLIEASAQPYLNNGFDLVLDLGTVSGIDSAGIGQLVLLHMRALAAGCDVLIAAAAPQVFELLQLTNTANLFDFFDSVEEALQACSREVA